MKRLLLALCVAALPLVGSADAKGADANPAQPQQHTGHQPAQPMPASPVPRKAPNANMYKPNCGAPKNHDDADYCVQADMLKATQDQVALAREQTELSNLQDWIAGVEVLFFIVTVAFTAIATRAAAQSATAADGALKLQAKATEQQLRAFIFPTDMNIAAIFDSPQTMGLVGFMINGRWKNPGDTPARNVKTRVNLATFAAGMPDGFQYLDIYGTDETDDVFGFIGAETEVPAGGVSLILDEMTLVEPNVLRPTYMWGYVEYDDIFDGSPRHRTEFCARVEIVRDLAMVTPEQAGSFLQFKVIGSFNGMDDDCFRAPEPSQVRKRARG